MSPPIPTPGRITPAQGGPTLPGWNPHQALARRCEEGTQKRSPGVGHVGAGTADRLLRHERSGIPPPIPQRTSDNEHPPRLEAAVPIIGNTSLTPLATTPKTYSELQVCTPTPRVKAGPSPPLLHPRMRDSQRPPSSTKLSPEPARTFWTQIRAFTDSPYLAGT